MRKNLIQSIPIKLSFFWWQNAGEKYVFCSHSLRTTQQAIIQSTMNGDIFILAKNITLLMQMVDNDVCVLILLDDDFVLNMQLMTVWSLNACFYCFAWSSWWLKISIQTFCFYIKKTGLDCSEYTMKLLSHVRHHELLFRKKKTFASEINKNEFVSNWLEQTSIKTALKNSFYVYHHMTSRVMSTSLRYILLVNLARVLALIATQG